MTVPLLRLLRRRTLVNRTLSLIMSHSNVSLKWFICRWLPSPLCLQSLPISATTTTEWETRRVGSSSLYTNRNTNGLEIQSDMHYVLHLGERGVGVGNGLGFGLPRRVDRREPIGMGLNFSHIHPQTGGNTHTTSFGLLYFGPPSISLFAVLTLHHQVYYRFGWVPVVDKTCVLARVLWQQWVEVQSKVVLLQLDL